MLYIFDFDFTLIDASVGIMNCFKSAYKAIGVDMPDEKALRSTIGMPLDMAFLLLGGKEDAYPAFYEGFIGAVGVQMIENARVFPYTLSTLSALKARGDKIAVYSAKDRSSIDGIMRKFAINDLVDMVVGHGDCAEKPSPEGIEKVASALGFKKSEAVYIGDAVIDFKTATNAGVRFTGVLSGVSSKEDFIAAGCENIVQNISCLV